MVNTVEQNTIFFCLVNLFIKLSTNCIVNHKWLLNGSKLLGELNRSFVICRDVTDTHQSRLALLVCLLNIFTCQHSWELWLPVNTVDKEWNIWQIFIKLALVQVWILIIVSFVEGFIIVSLSQSDQVLRWELRNDDCFIVLFDILISDNFKIWFKILRLNFNMRETFKNLHNSFSYSSSSSDGKNHWRFWLW